MRFFYEPFVGYFISLVVVDTFFGFDSIGENINLVVEVLTAVLVVASDIIVGR